MQNNIRQLLAIVRGRWLIEPITAQELLPVVAAWLQGENVHQLIGGNISANGRFGTVKPQAGELTFFDNPDEAPPQSTGIVRAEGVLEKNDFCGILGMATLGDRLRMLDEHPNIGSVVLVTDTPGGTVDGTKDLADTVAGMRKPVVAWVDGMAASAGYWVVSGASEIMLSNQTSFVGSIGTVVSLTDFKPVYEKMGVKFHTVFAEEAYEKNRDFLELLKGNYKPIQENELNPINEVFMDAVRNARPSVKDEALHGRMFIAEAAIEMGLADSIGTLQQAIHRAQELANATQPDSTFIANQVSSNHNSNSMFTKNKFPKLTALAGAESLTPELVQAVNEEIEQMGIQGVTLLLDTELEAETERVETLENELDTARAALSTAEERITNLEQEREALQQQVEELGSEPGDSHTQPGKPGGDNYGTPSSQQVIDDLPHNKALDGNPIFTPIQEN